MSKRLSASWMMRHHERLSLASSSCCANEQSGWLESRSDGEMVIWGTKTHTNAWILKWITILWFNYLFLFFFLLFDFFLFAYLLLIKWEIFGFMRRLSERTRIVFFSATNLFFFYWRFKLDGKPLHFLNSWKRRACLAGWTTVWWNIFNERTFVVGNLGTFSFTENSNDWKTFTRTKKMKEKKANVDTKTHKVCPYRCATAALWWWWWWCWQEQTFTSIEN